MLGKSTGNDAAPSGETYCVWCRKPFLPQSGLPNTGTTPVCPHCYNLLSQAGVPDYEIFEMAAPEDNKLCPKVLTAGTDP